MCKRLNLHLLFEAGVIVKGLHALVELVSAFVIYFLGNAAFLVVTRLTASELAEDSQDVFANFFLNQTNHILSARGFVALYLVASAIINLIIVAGLLSNRLRAYPASMGVLSLFILYQVYRISLTHSVWLSIFTLFDIAVIYLIYQEYGRQKKLRGESIMTHDKRF